MRIRAEGITFAYRDRTWVVANVHLTVENGELVGLIGPNGSGKTTLLKLISGVLRPSAGRIWLGGDDVQSLSVRSRARRVAMVAQDRPLGFDYSVREVVAMGRTPYIRRLAGESRRDRRAIRDAMHMADVGGLADRSIREISGGERQRVFLAMALAQQPEVLLLDEPTTHLDLGHQARFLTIVRERAVAGCTSLLAIHDLTLAAQTADRIALLSEGRIVRTGTPREVLTQQNVRSVFGVDVHLGTHAGGRLYVLPVLDPEAGDSLVGNRK